MTDRQLPPATFEGAQLSQMRKWVNSGGGSGTLYDTASLWQTEDKFLRDLKGEIEGKLKQVGAVMQSKSGEAMQNQAMPVVLWTEVTADQAKLQSEQMTASGEAFKKVQDSIPAESEEKSVPDDSWLEEGWDNMWTGSTDAEDAKAHNEKLRQDAVQAFNTYQETSQNNVSGSAVFQKPPEIAVQEPGGASSSAHPSVGGVQQPASTSSSSAGSAGAASGTGAGAVGGSGGGYAGSGSGAGNPAGTGSAWANAPGSGGNAGNGGGNAGGAGARPGAPGYAGGTAGRPGMPGAGRPGAGSGSGGARGGAGSGAGRGVGAGGGAGRAGGPGMGAGGRAGAGGLGGAAGSTAAGGAAGGAGGRGGAGMGGAGARGSGQQGEEDAEHETPDYLVGDQGVFDEDLPRVAPPVFGE